MYNISQWMIGGRFIGDGCTNDRARPIQSAQALMNEGERVYAEKKNS